MSTTVVRNVQVGMVTPDVIGAEVKVHGGKVVVELLNGNLLPVVNLYLTLEAAHELIDRLETAADDLLSARMAPVTAGELLATIRDESQA